MAKLGPEYINVNALKAALATEVNVPRIVDQSGLTTNTDGIIHADASAGDITISLMSAVSYNGPGVTIKKIDDTVNQVIIECDNPVQSIDGNESFSINNQNDVLQFYSDGTNWFVK